MKSFTNALASTAAVSLALLTRVAADEFSDFALDDRLHASFWGFAYTPENSAYYPNCGDTIEQVSKDIQLLSQLTTRIRLYGSDCDQLELVLEAIKRTKTNIHVYPGIFIDGNETTYERQRDTTFTVLDKYGVDGILGITVGNEYILQQSADGAGAAAEALVIEKMADVKAVVASKGYGKTIPIGTADAGSQITATLSAAADYIMANTHPFFSGINIDGAAAWTMQYLINDEPRFATAAGKTLFNAEIGWPTDALPGGALTLNGSAASVPNLQTLLDTFLCQANTEIEGGSGNGYFFFELFDANWKRQYLGAEPFWGLFDPSPERVLKDLTIPNCVVAGEALLSGANQTPGGSGTGNGPEVPSSGGSSNGNSPTGGNTGNSGASSLLSLGPGTALLSGALALAGALSLL